ncbi:MAG TPA: hypothetical protein VK436_16070 [Methanocella sp.]|nr:hypothetical protein [Methanocella sp.]
MADPNIKEKVDEAVTRGDYPDKKTAVEELTKGLIDVQKGMLKGRIVGNPVVVVENSRVENWTSMLQQAGGDENKAMKMYADEIKKSGV